MLPLNVDWSLMLMKLKKAQTYKQLAKLIGISKPSIEVYMSSRARKPNYETGAKIINAYLKHYNEVPRRRDEK